MNRTPLTEQFYDLIDAQLGYTIYFVNICDNAHVD